MEADDGAGESNSVGTFTVTVTVTNVNETPEVPAGVPDESFAEIEWDADSADLDVMTYIPRDEETSAADLAASLSWSLAGTDAADFQITEDSTTGHGTLSFRDRPNFEDPTDRVNTTESHAADDNMYQVIVKISDGPNTRDYPLTVTVTNVNETPQFTHSTLPSSAWNANEIEYDSGITAADMASIPATVANQAYWYWFEARDEEGQDIIWTITGPDAADFVIVEDPNVEMANSDERAIARWNIVPDRENPMGLSPDVPDHGYVFTVNASDGTNTSIHRVFIRIDDVNERPEFTGTPTATISLDEHDATLNAELRGAAIRLPGYRIVHRARRGRRSHVVADGHGRGRLRDRQRRWRQVQGDAQLRGPEGLRRGQRLQLHRRRDRHPEPDAPAHGHAARHGDGARHRGDGRHPGRQPEPRRG